MDQTNNSGGTVFVTSTTGFVPGKPTQIEHFVPGRVQCNQVLGVLQEWSTQRQIDDDPIIALSLSSNIQADATCRSKRMTVSQWAKYDIYEAIVDPIRAADSLAIWFRYPHSDRIRGYAFQRLGNDREFSDKDVELARVFAQELYALFEDGLLEPANLIAKLPDRLQRLLPYLLGELSQKQIATQVGLSYHTVRSYT